jgi:ABC-type dipeptide/oligopeptide/nickel transport system ATPase component
MASLQSELRVTLPFHDMNQNILSWGEEDARRSLGPGDSIELIGPSGSGKSWIMHQIASYTLRQVPTSSILLIDLDERFEDLQDERFHFFQPGSALRHLILGLEHWLETHADKHILWVMIDGKGLGTSMMNKLKQVQSKWAFVLLTSTHIHSDSSKRTFRYELSRDKNGRIQMQMVYPSLQTTFVT